MTESRRTSRPDSSGEDAGKAADREPRRRRPPRPLDSAGRPVQGFSTGAPNGSGRDAATGGRRSPPGEPPEFDEGEHDWAGSDWERLRESAAGAGGAKAPSAGPAPSLSSFLQLLDALRAMLPQELERQFAALVREVLLTLRALIDWYLERLEEDESDRRRVEDIPID
jgi:hypothetical protein